MHKTFISLKLPGSQLKRFYVRRSDVSGNRISIQTTMDFYHFEKI